MKISSKAISDKVKNYVKSSNGKEAVKQAIDKSEMIAIAKKLVQTIKTFLPPSIQNDVEIEYGELTKTENGWQIEINFDPESIFRNSLLNDGDSGYGVTNIVALLNNGYHAHKQVYGYWNTAGRNIWSRQDRETLRFMQKAISNFNNNVGVHYNCTAKLSNAYTK